MKKIIFILLCLQTITISCSNDDGNSNHSTLVGKWDYFQEPPFDWPHACSSIKDNVEFFSNGNYKESSYLNNCQLDSNNSGNGSWTLNGNNLTINIWGEIYTYQIVTLNNETLELRQTYDIQPGDPVDGVSLVFTRN
jgi:hypothetical protein